MNQEPTLATLNMNKDMCLYYTGFLIGTIEYFTKDRHLSREEQTILVCYTAGMMLAMNGIDVDFNEPVGAAIPALHDGFLDMKAMYGPIQKPNVTE